MSINLLEAVQQNLRYPPLQKIDTGTDQIKENDNTPDEHKFSQAAIPAVLMAIYRFVQTDEGATAILQEEITTDWVKFIFDDKRKEAIETIVSYSGLSKESVISKMNDIASEAVKVVRENLSGDADMKEVKLYFSSQKMHILLYLLPILQMGVLLHDNTLDDKTNKMEGPISSLINTIGNAFSKPVSEEEVTSK
jgi:H+/gluconate symporter-like permease